MKSPNKSSQRENQAAQTGPREAKGESASKQQPPVPAGDRNGSKEPDATMISNLNDSNMAGNLYHFSSNFSEDLEVAKVNRSSINEYDNENGQVASKAGPDDEMDAHTGDVLGSLKGPDRTLGDDASEEDMACIEDRKEEMNENNRLQCFFDGNIEDVGGQLGQNIQKRGQSSGKEVEVAHALVPNQREESGASIDNDKVYENIPSKVVSKKWRLDMIDSGEAIGVVGVATPSSDVMTMRVSKNEDLDSLQKEPQRETVGVQCSGPASTLKVESEKENKKTNNRMNIRRRIIGNYYVGKSIGEGTFGKVKMGTHTLTGERVAIKILEKERITDVSDVERVAREIHILKLIRHPNIIQLYEIIETPRTLYLIMEYASGGELFDYIVKHTRLKEDEACKFYQQIIAGVEYMHRLNIVHRDLKPENLLLDHEFNIKIVDFGLSNTFTEGETLKTACGSPCYAAPEMIAGRKYVGTQVDSWSCGIILFALICGFLPFEDPDTTELYKKILKGEYHIPSFVSKDAKDLLSKIMVHDPEKRSTPADIRAHPWFQKMHAPVCEAKGLIVGYTHMLYEETILAELEEKGFQRDKTVRYLDANKHNHETTCYYLILKKLEKEGKIDKRKYFSGQNLLNQRILDQVKDGKASEKSRTQRERRLDLQVNHSEQSQAIMEKQYLSDKQRAERNRIRENINASEKKAERDDAGDAAYVEIDSAPFQKRKSKSTERNSRQYGEFQAHMPALPIQQSSSRQETLQKLVAQGKLRDQKQADRAGNTGNTASLESSLVDVGAASKNRGRSKEQQIHQMQASGSPVPTGRQDLNEVGAAAYRQRQQAQPYAVRKERNNFLTNHSLQGAARGDSYGGKSISRSKDPPQARMAFSQNSNAYQGQPNTQHRDQSLTLSNGQNDQNISVLSGSTLHEVRNRRSGGFPQHAGASHSIRKGYTDRNETIGQSPTAKAYATKESARSSQRRSDNKQFLKHTYGGGQDPATGNGNQPGLNKSNRNLISTYRNGGPVTLNLQGRNRNRPSGVPVPQTGPGPIAQQQVSGVRNLAQKLLQKSVVKRNQNYQYYTDEQSYQNKPKLNALPRGGNDVDTTTVNLNSQSQDMRATYRGPPAGGIVADSTRGFQSYREAQASSTRRSTVQNQNQLFVSLGAGATQSHEHMSAQRRGQGFGQFENDSQYGNLMEANNRTGNHLDRSIKDNQTFTINSQRDPPHGSPQKSGLAATSSDHFRSNHPHGMAAKRARGAPSAGLKGNRNINHDVNQASSKAQSGQFIAVSYANKMQSNILPQKPLFQTKYNTQNKKPNQLSSIQSINLVGPPPSVVPRATINGAVAHSSSSGFFDPHISSARAQNDPNNIHIVNNGGDYYPVGGVGGLPGGLSSSAAAPTGGGGHIVNINFNGANQSITQNFLGAMAAKDAAVTTSQNPLQASHQQMHIIPTKPHDLHQDQQAAVFSYQSNPQQHQLKPSTTNTLSIPIKTKRKKTGTNRKSSVAPQSTAQVPVGRNVDVALNRSNVEQSATKFAGDPNQTTLAPYQSIHHEQNRTCLASNIANAQAKKLNIIFKPRKSMLREVRVKNQYSTSSRQAQNVRIRNSSGSAMSKDNNASGTSASIGNPVTKKESQSSLSRIHAVNLPSSRNEQQIDSSYNAVVSKHPGDDSMSGGRRYVISPIGNSGQGIVSTQIPVMKKSNIKYH